MTVDSSVFVAALREEEPHHRQCRALLEKVKRGEYLALEPYTVLIEIVAAIKRRTGKGELAERVKSDLLQLDTVTFLELEEVRANEAADIAKETGVRGMDAVVAQIASEFRASLITLDDEMNHKLKGVVSIKAPDGL